MEPKVNLFDEIEDFFKDDEADSDFEAGLGEPTVDTEYHVFEDCWGVNDPNNQPPE